MLTVSYLRTLLSGGVKGAPHNAPLGPFHTSFHELLIDGLFHKDSRPCSAALALVEEHALVSLLHSVVHYKRKHRILNTTLSMACLGSTFLSTLQRSRNNVLLITAYASKWLWTENTDNACYVNLDNIASLRLFLVSANRRTNPHHCHRRFKFHCTKDPGS